MPRFRPHQMYPGALLAQECCSYQASTELLVELQGDFAVIVHSDRDCSNVIPKTQPPMRDNFFCTNMREDELVTGQGNTKLRRAIELVWQARQPKLIVVLATCPTVMIGDNIKNVARKAGRELKANVVASMTNGLRPMSPAEVVDDCYLTLSSGALPLAEGVDVDRRVNFVGMTFAPEELDEVRAVLAAMGLAVNSVLSLRSSLDDFLALRGARLNVHPGPNFMLRFDEKCAEFGQRAVEVPLPFGLRATDAFYRAIGKAAAVEEAVIDAAIRERRDRAATAVREFRERLTTRLRADKGRAPRCAFNVGSVRSFDLRTIGLEEMGELPLIEELGFDCEIYVQGPTHEDNRKRTASVLQQLGMRHPFVIFPDPGGLGRVIPPGRFDVFVGIDFLQQQLSRVGLPLFEKRRLPFGYGALPRCLADLEAAVFTRFYEHVGVEATAPSHNGARPPVALPVVNRV